MPRPCRQDLCEDGDLPAVFWSSLRFLSTNALQVPGLFTDCSEDNRKVLLMRRLYDNGQDPIKLLPAASRDPRAVAGVLKLWFSCLPEPVIPPEMYAAFLRTQRHRSPEAQVAGIHAVLRQCEHRVLQVLYPLMEFLHHYRINQKQTPELGRLLARIFAPVLLVPDDIDADFQTEEEREAAVAVVEHMIRDYRVLFSQRKRGRPLLLPADDADDAVAAVERAERMPSAAAQPRHPLPLANVAGGGGGSATGMRCRIPTPGGSHATADHEPSAAQPLGAAAGTVGPSAPFASPRAPPEGPPDWDEVLGDTADGDLEDLVCQMMLSSTARLFDGGAEPAEGDPLGRADEADAAGLGASAQARSRSTAEAASAAGGQQQAAAKPLNSPDSHVELLGAVPTDVDDSGSERYSLELPRSPQHGGLLSPALLSPSGRGSPGDSGRAHLHHNHQQQQQPPPQPHPDGEAFPLPFPGGAAADGPLDGDLYSVARGAAAAVGVGYSPWGPSRSHSVAQLQPNSADLAGSPRSDAGSDSGGSRPPSGQHHSQQQQQQRQQWPRDLPHAIPRLQLGASLSDGLSSSAQQTGGSGSGSGRALKLSPESAVRAEQRRGRRSGGSSPMESPKDCGALWQGLCREDAMAAVEAAALEPLEHLSLAELNSRKTALKRQLRSLDSAFEGALGRAPAKTEKEHLRPLYVRYWRLKAAIREASQKAGQ